ncbi:FCD domain-containing protein [Geodermatophilus sp. SYSU D00742]
MLPRPLAQSPTLLEFLETELLRTARRPTDDEVAELRAINAEMARSAAAGDLTVVNRLNSDLHLRTLRLSPPDLYLAEAERCWASSAPRRMLHVATTDAAGITEEHEQLVDALAAQDRALTLRMTAAHRGHSQDAARHALTGIDQPVRLATG